jgi:hypothetical protein
MVALSFRRRLSLALWRTFWSTVRVEWWSLYLKVLVYCFTSSKLEAKHGELQIAKSTFEVVFFF